MIDHDYADASSHPTPESRTSTPRYADDISWVVTGSHELLEHYKHTVPPNSKEDTSTAIMRKTKNTA